MSHAASIAVAVRVRPPTAWEAGRLAPAGHQDNSFMGDGHLTAAPKVTDAKPLRPIVQVMDDKVLIFDPKDPDASRAFEQRGFVPPGTKRYKDQRYTFDRVFDEDARQIDVFEGTTKPLLDGLMDGFNATVFAYGATGCGKTHTISGTEADPGIIYATMAELFQRIEDRKDEYLCEVSLSFLEIYNEEIRDLLTESGSFGPRGGLTMREDKSNRVIISNLTEHKPANADEVKEMVLLGNTRRTQSPTHANETSSRSHAVLQINVMQTPRTAGVTEEHTMATLSIIDLAGSERASATRNMGERMLEGANINKSLLALGNCINALCESGGRTRHIPYRNSKLTRLLKFSLGGNCKTVMIVCVAPTSLHFEDTQNTLKYANRAKNIKTKVSRNFVNIDRHVAQYVEAINRLNEEVKELKAKLAGRTSSESDVLNRRKLEAKVEMERAKEDMLSKVNANLPVFLQGASCEATIFIATTRLRAIKARLARLESQPPTSDLLAERGLLQSFAAADEAIVRADSTAVAQAQKARNASSLFEATLRAVSERKSDRLDEFNVDSVRLDAKLKKAEVDRSKAESREAVYKAALEQQSEVVANLVEMLAKCTVMMNDGGRILREAAGNGDGLHGVVTSVAESMGRVGEANDVEFTKLVGQTTSSFVSAKDTSSLLNFSGHTTTAAIANTAKPQRRSPRRSLAPPPRTRRSSVAGPVPASPARRFHKSPRKAAALRQSLAHPGVLFSRPEYVPAPSRKVPEKQLRWRDEAGEGEIDDHGERPASSAAPAVTLNAPVRKPSESESDWEDEKTQDNSNVFVVSPDVPGLSIPPPPPPMKRMRSNRMDPNYLRSKAASALSSLAEDDESRASPLRPKPFSDVANQPVRMLTDGSPRRVRDRSPPKELSSIKPVPSSPPKNRRRSNIGPMRPEKTSRRRSSLIPKANVLPANAPAMPASKAMTSFGAPRRLLVNDADVTVRKSPKKVRRISIASHGAGRYSIGGPGSRAGRASLAPQRTSPPLVLFDPNASADLSSRGVSKPTWR
ncbi:hypothetical protein BOTBODRAFT_50820 [Botryobasidium botryosum FD-172 SS1]|uniref:Kinesin motor domain-containing protein n=1 Tax=Botryobasidium botryosum (strain FD-172 SS1) TaxID=930990 RepID=A0A067N1D5_BOTB1|nr:hypothetical protein BOTBODRAFT_50820 [Botryobasidium botryosum FD-172 SS1]